MSHKVLVTTAIDYVNDVIHIGHAYQKIVADTLARYHRQIGDETFFLTGTDEHGSKTEETAEVRGITPKQVADEISAQDQAQLDALNISYDRFIRTTDSDHAQVVKEFYQRSFDNGDIYLGEYSGLYCVGCETYLKEKDFVDGKCPYHPTKEPTTVTEKNYFFAWTKYSDFLKEYILSHPDFVQHEARKNEMLAFIDSGLEDIPITRPNVKFGIPVPNDPEHVLYVWFDALINYITGAPEMWSDEDTQIIHLLGKDNVRWHALLWPAMLKSAGYRQPSVIYAHDFFTINGKKISKSIGNILRPTDLVNQFGADAVRYYFLRYGPLRDDVDVTLAELTRVYNADLANDLGNLASRVAKMAEGAEFGATDALAAHNDIYDQWKIQIESFRIDLALELIWKQIQEANRFIDKNRIWEQSPETKKEMLAHLVADILIIAYLLAPFLPDASEKIRNQFTGTIKVVDSLFPRIK